MEHDLILYQFSRSKVECVDFSHFLSLYAPDKLPEGRRLRDMMNCVARWARTGCPPPWRGRKLRRRNERAMPEQMPGYGIGSKAILNPRRPNAIEARGVVRPLPVAEED